MSGAVFIFFLFFNSVALTYISGFADSIAILLFWVYNTIKYANNYVGNFC